MERKKKKMKYDPVRDAMMLTEYARNPRPGVIAKKHGVHHSYPKRLWDALSDEERQTYMRQADDVRDIAAEKIISEQADAITAINEQLINLTKLSIEEYGRRLCNNALKGDIKEKDLIAFISKAMAVVQQSTKSSSEVNGEGQSSSPVINIFEQSIQQNLSITKEYDYDEDE